MNSETKVTAIDVARAARRRAISDLTEAGSNIPEPEYSRLMAAFGEADANWMRVAGGLPCIR